MMNAGSPARLIQPEIRGVVVERRFNRYDELEYLLEWIDADGSTQTRWFTADQLEQLEEKPE